MTSQLEFLLPLLLLTTLNAAGADPHAGHEHGSTGHPTEMIFNLAFGSNPQSVAPILARLNGGAAGSFIRQDIVIHIESSERIGGAILDFSGCLFDYSNKLAITAQFSCMINSPIIIINKVPLSKYKLEIRSEDIFFSQTINIIEGRSDYSIIINRPRVVTGAIVGMPTFALESPIVNIASDFALIDSAGKFSIKTRTSPPAPLRVMCRMLNNDRRFKMPLYEVEWTFPDIGKDEYILSPPGALNGGSLFIQLSPNEDIEKAGLAPMLNGLAVYISRALDSEMELAFRLNADSDRSATVVNIPPGRYKIALDERITPLWLTTDAQTVEVGDRETESVELKIRLP